MVASYAAIRITWTYCWIIFVAMIVLSIPLAEVYSAGIMYDYFDRLLYDLIVDVCHIPLLIVAFLIVTHLNYREFKLLFAHQTIGAKLTFWWQWFWRSALIVYPLMAGVQMLNFMANNQFEWVYYVLGSLLNFFIDFKILKYLFQKRAADYGVTIEVIE